MRTYKLTISYDGTKYQGWQRQVSTNNTIQWILEWTIGKIVGYRVKVHGSGRTDSGVHALAQVAHAQFSGLLDVDNFLIQLNDHLPDDIKVFAMELVPNTFHARKSAVKKCYVYGIDMAEKPDVFTSKYYYHFTKPLNIDAMKEAAKLLVGEHNFASFTDSKKDQPTVRKIEDIRIEVDGSKLRIYYYGNGFMYHMVRILTGTLLEMGIGEKYPSQIPIIIAAFDRKFAGFLVPPRGLFLRRVFYNSD